LSAGDGESGSGVAVTAYNLDDTGWTTYSGPFRVTRRGTHHLVYRSVDAAGNVESNRTVRFKIK
jgi:cytochrome c